MWKLFGKNADELGKIFITCIFFWSIVDVNQNNCPHLRRNCVEYYEKRFYAICWDFGRFKNVVNQNLSVFILINSSKRKIEVLYPILSTDSSRLVENTIRWENVTLVWRICYM